MPLMSRVQTNVAPEQPLVRRLIKSLARSFPTTKPRNLSPSLSLFLFAYLCPVAVATSFASATSRDRIIIIAAIIATDCAALQVSAQQMQSGSCSDWIYLASLQDPIDRKSARKVSNQHVYLQQVLAEWLRTTTNQSHGLCVPSAR